MEKAKLQAVVGANNVLDDETVLGSYAWDLSFTPPVRPELVVRPQRADQVREIVALAGETGMPLVPVSSGPPHFRGDTVPGAGGSVIVDLSGLKKILHIDRRNRVAMVEPGVTFAELIPAVAEQGLRLNLPLMPRRTKSVVGSLLEREPVIMPKYHWDISDPLACLEIVFGNGATYRTGAAAGSGTLEEQWAAGGAQKEAAGPSSASWYRLIQGAQGQMGIVTWASTRCELLPERESPFFIASDRLDKVLEAVHWLIRLRLVNECFIVNDTNMTRMTTGPDRRNGNREHELPRWLLFCNVAAYDFLPDERMRGQLEDVRQLADRLGVELSESVGGVAAADVLQIVRRPSDDDYWKLRGTGGVEDIMFLALYDKLPVLLDTMYAAAQSSDYPGARLGVYLQPLVQGVNCHCEFSLYYDPGNPAEARRIREISLASTRQLAARGAYFSRPYGESAPFIINRDAASGEALRRVKHIADPQGIMNPGKLFP